MSEGARTRAIAASILARLQGRKGSLSNLLARYDKQSDLPLIQEICYGVCRYYYPLNSAVSALLEKPLRAKDLDVFSLLLAGAYQIFCMRIPDHAAVNETVHAVQLLKKPWARGLVNGVLRQLLRQPELWQNSLSSEQEELRYRHPQWLIDRIRQDWPAQWSAILEANNQKPPMTLRVNGRQTTRAGYLRQLSESGIDAKPGGLAETAVYLDSPLPGDSLPGFSQGQASVQDEASQLVPGLLDLQPGQRVLDACAAPGGKTTHLLESEPSLTELTALDIDARRTRSIAENLQRLGLTANVLVGDAATPESWWDGEPFDRILLDAPCTATGVIRRHPDIRLLLEEGEVARNAGRQLSLLHRVFHCLKPGGLLLYTTCSVLAEENDETVARFLAEEEVAKYQAITADWGVKCRYGRQLLPDRGTSDGFYFALLGKLPSSRRTTA